MATYEESKCFDSDSGRIWNYSYLLLPFDWTINSAVIAFLKIRFYFGTQFRNLEMRPTRLMRQEFVTRYRIMRDASREFYEFAREFHAFDPLSTLLFVKLNISFFFRRLIDRLINSSINFQAMSTLRCPWYPPELNTSFFFGEKANQ